jgi:hypothetical protein
MSFVSSLFGLGGNAPPPPPPVTPPPAPPTMASASVQAASEQAGLAAAAASGQGFGDTLKTSPLGAKTPSTTTGAATLGG